MFSTTVLGGAPVVPESNEWYVVTLEYALSEEFYSVAEQQWRERDPRYACCENLVEMARQEGVFPRAASFASTYITITGVAGSNLPKAIQVMINDIEFSNAVPLPLTLPSSGTLTVRFQAVQPGAIGNDLNGATTGRILGSITGVDRTVTVNGSLACGGRDAEDCEAFRTRYLARKQYAPVANDAWVQQQLLSWPCVTRVCTRGGTCCSPADDCGCSSCRRKLNYYVFMDDTFDCGVAPECVVNEINTWMFGPEGEEGYGRGQAPIGVRGKVHVATAGIVDVHIAGLGCFTSTERSIITERLQAYFKTLCPSTILSGKQIEAIILQVTGQKDEFDVVLSARDDTLFTNYISACCSDLEMECDVIACLGNVTFVDNPALGGCFLG